MEQVKDKKFLLSDVQIVHISKLKQKNSLFATQRLRKAEFLKAASLFTPDLGAAIALSGCRLHSSPTERLNQCGENRRGPILSGRGPPTDGDKSGSTMPARCDVWPSACGCHHHEMNSNGSTLSKKTAGSSLQIE